MASLSAGPCGTSVCEPEIPGKAWRWSMKHLVPALKRDYAACRLFAPLRIYEPSHKHRALDYNGG